MNPLRNMIVYIMSFLKPMKCISMILYVVPPCHLPFLFPLSESHLSYARWNWRAPAVAPVAPAVPEASTAEEWLGTAVRETLRVGCHWRFQDIFFSPCCLQGMICVFLDRLRMTIPKMFSERTFITDWLTKIQCVDQLLVSPYGKSLVCVYLCLTVHIHFQNTS